MLGANINPKIVSEMLGHSQTAFTMDRYQHVNLQMQREAVKVMEAATSYLHPARPAYLVVMSCVTRGADEAGTTGRPLVPALLIPWTSTARPDELCTC
jgi:hypothetical protein